MIVYIVCVYMHGVSKNTTLNQQIILLVLIKFETLQDINLRL